MIGWTGDRMTQQLDAPVYSTQKLDSNDTIFFGTTVGEDNAHYLNTNMHMSHMLPEGVQLNARYLRFYSDPLTLKYLQRAAFVIVRVVDRDMLILPCRVLDASDGCLSRKFLVPLVLESTRSFMVILRMNEPTKRNVLITAIFEGITTRPR